MTELDGYVFIINFMFFKKRLIYILYYILISVKEIYNILQFLYPNNCCFNKSVDLTKQFETQINLNDEKIKFINILIF